MERFPFRCHIAMVDDRAGANLGSRSMAKRSGEPGRFRGVEWIAMRCPENRGISRGGRGVRRVPNSKATCSHKIHGGACVYTLEGRGRLGAGFREKSDRKHHFFRFVGRGSDAAAIRATICDTYILLALDDEHEVHTSSPRRTARWTSADFNTFPI